MNKVIVFLFLAVFSCEAFGLGTMSCSDSTGNLVYSYKSVNKGTTPQTGEWLSTTQWEFKRNTIFTQIELFNLAPVITGEKVEVAFDESSKILITGTPFDDNYVGAVNRIFTIVATINKPQILGLIGSWHVLCHETIPLPAP